MWKSLKVGAALSGVLFLGLTGCGQQPPAAGAPKGPSPASQQWEKLTAGFIQSYFDAQPFFAAQSGKHQYDGQLPDLSNHGIRREIAERRVQSFVVEPAVDARDVVWVRGPQPCPIGDRVAVIGVAIVLTHLRPFQEGQAGGAAGDDAGRAARTAPRPRITCTAVPEHLPICSR